MNRIAKGTFTVSLSPLTFEGADPEFQFGRMAIDKQISGDLEATTIGQMLSAMTGTQGSAGYVAIERVAGVLNGKAGSFVLQHTGSMNHSRTAGRSPDTLRRMRAWIQSAERRWNAEGEESPETKRKRSEEFPAFVAPERDRLLREMVSAMNRVVALLYEDHLPEP